MYWSISRIKVFFSFSNSSKRLSSADNSTFLLFKAFVSPSRDTNLSWFSCSDSIIDLYPSILVMVSLLPFSSSFNLFKLLREPLNSVYIGSFSTSGFKRFISLSFLKISLNLLDKSSFNLFSPFKFSFSWTNFNLRVSYSCFCLSNSSFSLFFNSMSLLRASWSFFKALFFSFKVKCSSFAFLSSKLSSDSGCILSSKTAFLVL